MEKEKKYNMLGLKFYSKPNFKHEIRDLLFKVIFIYEVAFFLFSRLKLETYPKYIIWNWCFAYIGKYNHGIYKKHICRSR